MKAVNCDRVDIIELLLKANADVNLTDRGGATPLMWAAHRGYFTAVKAILETNRANLDLTNKGGYTALMLASENNYLEVVKILKQAGARD